MVRTERLHTDNIYLAHTEYSKEFFAENTCEIDGPIVLYSNREIAGPNDLNSSCEIASPNGRHSKIVGTN